MPGAIKTVSGFWNETLLPAISAVWNFLSTYVIPLVSALSDFYLAGLGLALRIAASVFTNVLLPAVKDIVKWLSEKLFPSISSVASWVTDKLTPAFNWLGQAVKDVTSFIGGLSSALNAVKVPDIFQPGSPTPFEMGMRGIAQQLDTMTRMTLPAFSAKLQLQPVGIGSIAAKIPGRSEESGRAGAAQYGGPSADAIGRAVAYALMSRGLAE